MVRKMGKNSEIRAILNRYKNTLDEFIDSLDTKPLDWPELINKGLRNTPKSKSSLMGLLEGNYLDEDISGMSLGLTPKT